MLLPFSTVSSYAVYTYTSANGTNIHYYAHVTIADSGTFVAIYLNARKIRSSTHELYNTLVYLDIKGDISMLKISYI